MSEILKNQKGVEQNVLGLPMDRNIIFSNHKNTYKQWITGSNLHCSQLCIDHIK